MKTWKDLLEFIPAVLAVDAGLLSIITFGYSVTFIVTDHVPNIQTGVFAIISCWHTCYRRDRCSISNLKLNSLHFIKWGPVLPLRVEQFSRFILPILSELVNGCWPALRDHVRVNCAPKIFRTVDKANNDLVDEKRKSYSISWCLFCCT